LPLVFAAAALGHDVTVMEVRNGFYPASQHGGNYMHNFYIPPAPSSSPFAPAWAPDGKSIAVSMHSQPFFAPKRACRLLTGRNAKKGDSHRSAAFPFRHRLLAY
jgi:hypothetical protein